MALTYTPSPDLGQDCPDFDLRNVDGSFVSRAFLPKGRPFAIMFICNHCPYVQAIEDRLIQLGHDMHELGATLVGISSNDSHRYPADSPEEMKHRSDLKGYSFPYLYDEDQSVARAFGAVCTPDFFVYDNNGKLAYRGRLDDSWKDPAQVTRRELFEAVKLLAEGKPAPTNQAPSMGCSLKWKQP